MTLRVLQKWHGAGNDFLVDVHEQGQAPWWTPARARAVCERSTGVGADGLLIAALGPLVDMTLFNADGSTAAMSGNGARCLAAAVRRATHARWETLELTTPAGRRTVSLDLVGDEGRGSVAMGPVTIAKGPEGTWGRADVGNAHVALEDDASLDDASRLARAADLSNAVGGANVEFVRTLGTDRLALRVVELGVGWTRACGTGSVAAAALARGRGLVGDHVVVENPGGELLVTFDGDEATLEGPVVFVANVEWREA